MTNHTKLPWNNKRSKETSIFAQGYYDNDIEYLLASTEHTAYPVAVEKANAEFIVCACNNHYKLLKALVAMVNMVDYAVEAGVNGSISNNCITTENARQLIEEAVNDGTVQP